MIGFLWVIKMGPLPTKLTYLLWNSKVQRQSPPWERSRPCRRGFWTHPSRPRPLGGRSVGHERWGPRCKVYGLALCVRCERRARPRCCRHTATPDQTRQREEESDSSTPIHMRDSAVILFYLVSSLDPSFFSTVTPFWLLLERRLRWTRSCSVCSVPWRRHLQAKSFMLVPLPPLQPGVKGIVLSE